MSSNDTRRQPPRLSASANQHQPLGITLHSKRPRDEDTRRPLAALSPNVDAAKRRRESHAHGPAPKTQGEPRTQAAPSTANHPLQVEVEDSHTHEGEDTTDDDGDVEFCFGDATDEEYAESCDDIPDKDDDGEVGELSPVQQDSPSSPAAFVVDQHGHIRVGPQPVALRPFVRTAAAKNANVELRSRVEDNMNYRDSKFVNQPTLVQQRKAIVDDIPRRLVPYGHDRVSVVCDYTGLDISWAPGPFRISFEAIYPFAIVDDQVLYHAQHNTGYIITVMNWIKRNHPILVLPLVGLYLRTHQEPDFHVRKVTWTSTYTALLNVTIMHKVLHCGSSHTVRIDRCKKWTPEKQSAVLDHLRTGAFGPVIQDELHGWTVGKLFMQGTRTFVLLGPTAPSYWKKVYRWLIRIAQKHGLTRGEFEYYATVSAPNSSSGRVFFPFHVLAKAQAEGMAWDWCTIFGFTQYMLRGMRRQCNKHAERAGFGEQEMDPVRLIYWWCHHLCKKIQRVKSERPSGTQEEIAFYLLDRWGLPVVPWTGNVLKASLCKNQDHGIAMRFGLCLPGNGEDFDPVEHWDDFLCTVTIDSQATNMAMRDFPVASWGSIRDALLRVPCGHPFWRVDADLGLRCWVSDWDEPLATQLLPRPVPAIPLAPIDPWLGLDASPQFYGCTECPGVVSFPTAGLLLRHYQDKHWGDSATVGQTDAAQDAIDEAYWEETSRCKEPGCGKVFRTAGTLRRHTETIHAETKPQFSCMQPGCDKVYSDPGALSRHVAAKHSIIAPQFHCEEPDCGKTYTTAGGLRAHMNAKHSIIAPQFHCEEPGCGKTYITASNLRAHVEIVHAAVPKVHICPNCGRTFNRSDRLREHAMAQHSAVPPSFVCPQPGCGKSYNKKSSLVYHIGKKHPEGAAS